MSNWELYNQDCFDFMASMPEHSVNLILTDPPYDIANTGGGGSVNRVKKLKDSLQELDKAEITSGYDIEKFGEAALRIMVEPNIYFWCNKKQIPAYFNFWVNKHKCTFDILTWHKGNALPTYSNKYLSDTEYCLYFRKGKGKCFPESYDDAKTYYFAPINHTDKKKYGHPTCKPVDCLEKLVRNSTREGQVVFDPFAGSGSTGEACLLNNREFIGCELNETFYQTARTRLFEVQQRMSEKSTVENVEEPVEPNQDEALILPIQSASEPIIRNKEMAQQYEQMLLNFGETD